MPNITQYIFEGVDRLGKDTLIEALINKIGYHPVIHFQRPKILDIYENSIFIPEYEYQYASFVNMFQLLESKVPMIFNRAHLGETVYGPLYRGYDAEWVFDLERNFGVANFHHVKLVVLTCNNKCWDKIIDDGKSYNVENRVSEQWDFMDAYEQSILPNKQIVDIMTEGEFGLGFRRKTVEELLTEIGV